MKKRNKNMVIWIVVVAVAIGLLGFNTFANIISGGDSTPRSTRDVALSCTTDAFTKFHIHPHLEIMVNGARHEISSNVGVSLTCMHPLHTHDATGKIHVESPVQRDFELSDFFAVWDKPFSQNEILDWKTNETHEIIITVNGTRNDAYEKLILRDNDRIVIEYREKP